MKEHSETIANALRYYIQWMDALYRTTKDKDQAEECAIEKHKAGLALTEMENNK